MKRLVFSPAARDDLVSIGLYIAEDDPIRAQSFVAELQEKTKKILEWPAGFQARDDISPGLRSAVHGRYLILFRDLQTEIRIVRIVHGARNLRELIDE